jgi:mRNA-degrading endonuclease RelE of RelBE toxin-antitoxin system
MSYSVITLTRFEKDLKRLVKKYPSLKTEYINLVQSLKENPTLGVSLGNNCYKIRLSIGSKRKGKSGGARVITCVQVVNTSIYLLTIFDKSEQENITDKELKNLLNLLI